jgi:hypothetical protein
VKKEDNMKADSLHLLTKSVRKNNKFAGYLAMYKAMCEAAALQGGWHIVVLDTLTQEEKEHLLSEGFLVIKKGEENITISWMEG